MDQLGALKFRVLCVFDFDGEMVREGQCADGSISYHGDVVVLHE